jgi:hypothetical protein
VLVFDWRLFDHDAREKLFAAGGALRPVLEHMVSVNVTQIHTPGQLAADCGLSGAGQAHASDS